MAAGRKVYKHLLTGFASLIMHVIFLRPYLFGGTCHRLQVPLYVLPVPIQV